MYRPIELTRANSERTEGIEVRRERVAQGGRGSDTRTSCVARGGRGSDTRRGLLAAGLGLVVALLSLAAPALAQPDQPTPPLKWAARETYPNNGTASDEAVDMVYWQEVNGACAVTGNHWVYTTGWVTETDPLTGAVIGTRFATYRYDAAHPGPDAPPPHVAYYPEEGVPILTGNTYKAVAMTVDPSNGDIYVVGQGPRSPTDNNLDFHVVRYDKNLNPIWTSTVQYDGTAGGDDIAVDIRTNAQGCGTATYVVVAGTSPGIESGKDIVLVALHAGDGSPADNSTTEWAPDGVRRYNHTENGDDRAVELGQVTLTSETNSPLLPGLGAVVLGTSWGGPVLDDDIALVAYSGPDPAPDWVRRYDLTQRNDTAIGLCDNGFLFATGYTETEDPPPSFGPGGGGSTLNIDIVVIATQSGPNLPSWIATHDYFEDDDYPTDIDLTDDAGDHLWITGWTFNPNTNRSEFATLLYTFDFLNLTLQWAKNLPLAGSVVYGLRADGASDDAVYCTGAWNLPTRDAILTLKYTNPPPGTLPTWYRTYTMGEFDEGRAIIAVPVDAGSGVFSVFVTGTSSTTQFGRDFFTMRYKE